MVWSEHRRPVVQSWADPDWPQSASTAKWGSGQRQTLVNGGSGTRRCVARPRGRAAITLADAAGGFDDLTLHILDSSSPLQPARRPVALDLPLAQRAAGRYQLTPQFIKSVSVQGGRLHAQAKDQERFELKQDSLGDHYAEVVDIALRFTGTEAGRIDALTLRQGGGAFRATCID